MSQTCILYGAPCSLYTGKVRSYLIKQDIAFREITPAAEHYVKSVMPAIHRWRMPVIELPGSVHIQDSTMIIDYFENQPETPRMLPEAPKQRIAALLLDMIGAEGLLRPAMHYRWNFNEDNEAFLEANFRTLVPGESIEKTRAAIERMRKAAVSFGAVPDTFAVIEAVYGRLLDTLDTHFARYPYLLGGRPSLGDFGLIAPFYAHLSRDPYPSKMMKQRAPCVYRWTERMNRPDSDMGEFPNLTEAYLDADEIPVTLKAVLRFVGQTDLIAETKAAAECINQWLEQNRPEPETRVKRAVGFASFDIEGVPVQSLAQPYRFFMLQRMQAAFAGLDAAGAEEVRLLFAELDLTPLLTLTLNRSIEREDNLEVWR